MKKLFKALICGAIAAAIYLSFTACDIYTIQYIDDDGIHYINNLTEGELYSIESIPERTGYTFLGLFDAEVGGTQYVNSSGYCVSPFYDNSNITLYPQYKANEYTLVLDYGEADVTGTTMYTVTYNESLPELPTNLTVSHKVFSGWYTEEDCGGTKVADSNGLLPTVSIVNASNFEITSSTTYLYLYAGFTTETYTVTLYYNSGYSETKRVEYGASASDITSDYRNSDGYAVLSWGLSFGGSEYKGSLYDGMVLYALEWAPCIDFNSNGGDSVSSVIARAGETISLPTPTRESYKFMYWAYADGTEAELYEMPSASVTLKAVWQAMIIFDENGGIDVDDISEAAGTTLTLPTPEKDGYIFAGWYTTEGAQYTSTKMPSTSLELKAGWYKAKTETVILIDASSKKSYDNTSLTLKDNLTIDLSNILSENFSGNVEIDAYLKMYQSSASLSATKSIALYFYSQPTASDSYLLYSTTFISSSSSYAQYSYSMTVEMS